MEDNTNIGTSGAQPEETKGTTPEVTVTKQDGTTRAEVHTADDALTDVLDGGDKDAPAADKAPEDAGQTAEAQVQKDLDAQQQTEKEVKAKLAEQGVDFDALAAEYDRDGALSQKSLDALAQAGYPKSVVDAYIDGLEAKAERFVSVVKGYAGGEQAFEQLRTYLAAQPKDIIDGFNAAVKSGNLSEIRLAIEGVKANMVKAYGTKNPTIMGNGGAGTPAGYTSVEQMTKDMSDPRYQKDPAFTRDVIRKINQATFF